MGSKYECDYFSKVMSDTSHDFEISESELGILRGGRFFMKVISGK